MKKIIEASNRGAEVYVDKIPYTKLRSGVRLGPNGKEFQSA